MMRRCSRTSSQLTALALLLLVGSFHFVPAARLLPTAVPLVHQEDGVKAAADVQVIKEGAAGNGDEVSVSEMMGGAEEVEDAIACEEGNDECMQRRLLRDAHLDYIYTQHKGKP